ELQDHVGGGSLARAIFGAAARAHFAASQVDDADLPARAHEPQDRSANRDLRVVGVRRDDEHVELHVLSPRAMDSVPDIRCTARCSGASGSISRARSWIQFSPNRATNASGPSTRSCGSPFGNKRLFTRRMWRCPLPLLFWCTRSAFSASLSTNDMIWSPA